MKWILPKMRKPACLVSVLTILIVVVEIADSGMAADFVAAARWQVGKTLRYDGSYRALEYPNGDVPLDRGVCTDVVIRAMRTAFGFDLQKHVHEDMKRHFPIYPSRWGLAAPDSNIDHRRVPNLETFFRRQGWSLPVSDRTEDYLPGDIVTCIVPPRLPHIMVVSDRKSRHNVPLIIHNIGAGTREEDRLFEFKLTGHFRIDLPERPGATASGRRDANPIAD